jgi:hypothetical protein
MISIIQRTKFVKELVLSSIKLIVAGLIIGLLHHYDFWLALSLFILILWKFYSKLFNKRSINLVLIFGMIITGFIGLLVEYWGVSNGYWKYHNLSNARDFPYWLPFSWMLAFPFLYLLEIKLMAYITPKNVYSKIILISFIAAIFPVLGEIITIKLGVWTYYWPYQVLGVPLYAVIGLLTLHMFVNFILVIICKKWNFQDPIFSI